MNPAVYITTSWDDGHPLDLRVAELLTKHRISGTFYIPRIAENETMSAVHIRQLSLTFEIGAHTLHHADLTRATEQQAWQEIAGSKSWLEDNIGQPCRMFCPPKGKYSRRTLEAVRRAGFSGLRSVEWLSLDFPRLQESLRYGGVSHLWGDSWQLQATAQWHHLNDVLRFMSEFTSQVPSLTNGQICQRASSWSAHVGEKAAKVNTIRSEL